LLTNFIGASLIISSTGSSVIVVGDEIVYVPVNVAGGDIDDVTKFTTVKVFVVLL